MMPLSGCARFRTWTLNSDFIRLADSALIWLSRNWAVMRLLSSRRIAMPPNNSTISVVANAKTHSRTVASGTR